MTDLLAFEKNPLAFIKYNFPWQQPGSPLVDKRIRKWQYALFAEITQHVQRQDFAINNDLPAQVYKEVIRSGRGIGKTAGLAMLANWMVSTHIGATVTATANTEGQLRTKTFPEFGRWFTMGLNAHWWNCEGMSISPQKWLADLAQTQLRIDPKYWGVDGQNWSEENSDSFAGTHNSYGLMVVFDEASGIPEPIWSVTNGFFTEVTPYRIWLGFSNPRRNSGAFYNRHMSPAFEKQWRKRKINALTVEDMDHSEHEAIIETYGADSDEAKVEVYADFPNAGRRQLISTTDVRDAQTRSLQHIRDDQAPIIIGVDPAPRGRTVIRVRQGRDGRSIPRVVLNGANNIGITNEVVRVFNRYEADAIVVDAGMGTGVIDELRRLTLGRPVYEVWFGSAATKTNGEWATMGGELWGELAKWLPGACIDDAKELFRDLTVRTWDWAGREDAKKVLISKKEMEKDGIPSPDDADALALTFYPKIPRRTRGRNARNRMPRIITDGIDEPQI